MRLFYIFPIIYLKINFFLLPKRDSFDYRTEVDPKNSDWISIEKLRHIIFFAVPKKRSSQQLKWVPMPYHP